ncbi:MAG TPA: response regulator transcription factor [Thermoleophilaceae bacterium]|jgi:DNA-binding NarL/FixJ family response regulator
METTVLVVDDHPGFRRCARRLLEAHGYQVVGEAADGATALREAHELRPRLALVDVYLPDFSGFEVAERLVAIDPAMAVVLISSHDPAELKPVGAATGARGFIPKELLSREAIEEFL